MSNVTKLKVNWEIIIPYLATVRKNQINYTKFVKQYSVNLTKLSKRRFTSLVINSIIRAKKRVKKVFKQLDLDGDGSLEYSEFAAAVKKMDIGLNDEQILDFMHAIDQNNDGSIDYQEFEEAFTYGFSKIADEDDQWFTESLNDIALELIIRGEELEHLYKVLFFLYS